MSIENDKLTMGVFDNESIHIIIFTIFNLMRVLKLKETCNPKNWKETMSHDKIQHVINFFIMEETMPQLCNILLN